MGIRFREEMKGDEGTTGSFSLVWRVADTVCNFSIMNE